MKQLIVVVMVGLLCATCSKVYRPGLDTESETDSTSAPDSSTSNQDSGSGEDTDSESGWETDWPQLVECENLPVNETAAAFPNVLLLVDRSAAMANTVDSDDTLAQVVQSSVENLVLMGTQSGTHNFALNFFPPTQECTNQYRLDHDGLTSGGVDTDEPAGDYDITCEGASHFYWTGAPLTSPPAYGAYDTPTVPFADHVTPDTYTAIVGALETAGQCGGTPTCQSLWWAQQYIQGMGDSETPSVVVLITGSAPDCSKTLPPGQCTTALLDSTPASVPEECLDDACAINAAVYLRAAGVPVIVIGVGNGGLHMDNTLNAIAYYSTESATCAQLYDPQDNPHSVCPHPENERWYYAAEDGTQLDNAIEETLNETFRCEFIIDWDQLPETSPVTNTPLPRACHFVWPRAVLADPNMEIDTENGEDPNKLLYDEECSETHTLGWKWADPALANANWAEVQAENNVENCTRIKLCPRACEKMHLRNGAREWEALGADFGCQQFLPGD